MDQQRHGLLFAIPLISILLASCSGGIGPAVVALFDDDDEEPPPPPSPTAVIKVQPGPRYPGYEIVVSGESSRSNVSDPSLTFEWRLDGPADVALSSSSADTVRFTPGEIGQHRIRLEVTSQNGSHTAEQSIDVRRYYPPQVEIGVRDKMAVGRATPFEIYIDESSEQVDDVTVTVTVRPAGSSAQIERTDARAFVFTPDLVGEYTFHAVANDGFTAVGKSKNSEAIVDSNPIAMIAGVGPYSSRAPRLGNELVGRLGGAPIKLTSVGSVDPDLATLNDLIDARAWSLTTRPPGSAATLTIADEQSVEDVVGTLQFDVPGIYEVQLVVGSQGLESDSVAQRIRIFDPPYEFVDVTGFGPPDGIAIVGAQTIDIGAPEKRLVYAVQRGPDLFIERAKVDVAGTATIEISEPLAMSGLFFTRRLYVGDFVPGGQHEVAIADVDAIFLFDSSLNLIDQIALSSHWPWQVPVDVHDILGLGNDQLIGVSGFSLEVIHFDGVSLVAESIPLPSYALGRYGFYQRLGAASAGLRIDDDLFEFNGASWDSVMTLPVDFPHNMQSVINRDNGTTSLVSHDTSNGAYDAEAYLISFWPADEARVGSLGHVQGGIFASVPASATHPQRLVFYNGGQMTVVPVDADLVPGDAALYQWPEEIGLNISGFLALGDFTGDGLDDIIRVDGSAMTLMVGRP